MKQELRVISSTFLKEIRIWKRRPKQLGLVILLPLMFWIAFNVLMGGVYSSGIDVALVVEESNPAFYTNALIETLGEPDEIPPSMNLIPLSLESANAAFNNGDILLVIIIPDGFEEALNQNQSTSIRIIVNNMAEDQTKNVRMPVIRKLDIFYHRYLGEDSLVDFSYEPSREYSFPRLGYMAWTISVYSIMFASMYVSGSTSTQEYEQETFDEIRLSSQPMSAIYFGKLLTGVALGYITVPFLLVLPLIQYGVWPNGDLFSYLLLTVPLAIFCSSIGVVLGTIFRNSVYLVPTAAISGIFYWLISGGIAPLQIVGLSFDFVDYYSPISNVYRSIISMFIDGGYPTLFLDSLVVWSLAISFAIFMPILSERASQVEFGMRIKALRTRN